MTIALDSRTNRLAAVALVLGFLFGLTTMALHPTGRDVITDATAGGSNLLTSAVHLLALTGQVLLVSGTLALTVRFREQRGLATAAFTAFAFSTVAIIIAATASGLLGPMSVRGIAEADEVRRAAMMDALAYSGMLNQAFAKVSVVFGCLALALWSLALLLERGASRGLGILGFAVSAPVFAGVASGMLLLGIHGYLLVVLTQGAWFTGVAVSLWRAQGAPTG